MSARWHFGIVEDGKTILSSIGKNAESCWQEIPRHFSHVTVGEYVIMPDHIHGILKISVDSSDSIPPQIRDPEVTGIPTDHQNENETSLQKNLRKSLISPKSGSISTIIRSFKSAVTRWCHLNNYTEFAWQSRFHDHVIRDGHELARIERYIRDNPKQWDQDVWFKFL